MEEQGERAKMINAVEILDQGFACLVEHMGVVNAEYFIALIKQDKFDYTVWQRKCFDQLAPGEFAEKALAYARSHPYTGKGQIL